MPTTAFAPGSVTTVFVPRDSAASLGVSFATADGVTATVEPAPEPVIELDGRRAQVAAVSDVLHRLGTSAGVRLETSVPIGCGFGVSGAATLATALAANEEMKLGYDHNTLVERAHRAEVEAGTGLGDVFIQNRGGLVWNVGDGIKHSERTGRIEYVSYGEIATADVLGDDRALDRVVEAGQEALTTIDPRGGLPTLFEVSWAFADRVDLATERVVETVEAVRAAGGTATMAMIGETVVATGTSGVLEHETRITSKGAFLH